MASSPSTFAENQQRLEIKRKNLPDKSGCYLFKDEKGEILYIGKAKSLKKRVNSYWKPRSSTEDRFYAQKIRRLIELTAEIDVFIVENEMEALLLENELIKKHQPDFNVMLKDDKSFPWVQITNEKFPRIRIIRNPELQGLKHKYIGPFVDSGDLKRLLKLIRKTFPYCTCKKCVTPKSTARPCVNYQLKLCPGPCAGKITQRDYKENIDHIEQMLYGEIETVDEILTSKMNEASENLQFEQAAVFRDRLEALKIFTVEQSIFSYDLSKPYTKLESMSTKNDGKGSQKSEKEPTLHLKDLDVIAGKFSEKRAGMLIIHVRKGKLIGKTPYIVDLTNKITSKALFLIEFVKQHYLRDNIPLPDEIILKQELSAEVESIIIKKGLERKKKLIFRQPSEEDKTAGLLRIAQKNIELLIRQKDEYDEFLETQEQNQIEQSKIMAGLEELKRILNLEDLPMIIEGFDMAHTQGTDYTGSMVCFVEGKPSKTHYRHYKIKTVDKPDDVAAMREVMTRRYRRAIKEDSLPDLVVVDGGKPQLNMAHDLFQDLGIIEVPHIGLVKPEGRSEVYTPPKIVLPSSKTTIPISKDSPALHIIQHLRDESHRFANRYHQKLRQKRQSKSELDEIPGIGTIRKKKLLQYFGSVKEIKKTSESDLAKVIGPKLARVIKEFFVQKAENLKIEEQKQKKSQQSKTKSASKSGNASQKSSPKKKIVLKKRSESHANRK